MEKEEEQGEKEKGKKKKGEEKKREEDTDSGEKYYLGAGRTIEEIMKEVADPPADCSPSCSLRSGLGQRLKQALQEHVECEEHQRETREKYRQLFHKSVVPLYTTTHQGKILEVNRAFTDLLGYTAEELNDLRASDLYANPTERKEFLKRIEREGSVKEHEVQLKTKDGRTLTCLLSTTARKNGKEEYEFQGSIIDITDRKEAKEQLIVQAEHDSLTGLLNMETFTKNLNQSLAEGQAKNSAFMIIDFDRFQNINRMYGHTTANTVLKELAGNIESVVNRRLRTLHHDEKGLSCSTYSLVRLHSSNLGLMLPEANLNDAITIAETVRNTVKVYRHPAYQGATVNLTCRVGLTMVNKETPSADEAITQAEIAADVARERGGKITVIYDLKDPDIQAQHNARPDAKKAIDALEEGRAYLKFQDIVRLETNGGVVGWQPILREALLRLRSPDGKEIMPDDFIPTLERVGSIRPFQEWVVQDLFRRVQKGGGPYSANLSASSLNNPDQLEYIVRMQQEYNVDPSMIAWEFTETDVVKNPAFARDVINELSGRGYKVLLDDVGTGHFTIANLTELNVDMIKVGCERLLSLNEDPRPLDILKGVSTIARAYEKDVVIEYVENQEILDRILGLGLHAETPESFYYQGYLFGRPERETQQMLRRPYKEK